MRRQAKGRQKGRRNDSAGLNIFLLIYVKSDPRERMLAATYALALCVSSKEIEGKPWLDKEKE